MVARERVSAVSPLGHPLCPICLGACLSLAWRVMVPVSGRGSSGRSLTIAEDAPLDGAAGHLRSCSDLHGSGCARIRRSCSCGTTGRRICRSRGVSDHPFSPKLSLMPFIPRASLFAGQTASLRPLRPFNPLDGPRSTSPPPSEDRFYRSENLSSPISPSMRK